MARKNDLEQEPTIRPLSSKQVRKKTHTPVSFAGEKHSGDLLVLATAKFRRDQTGMLQFSPRERYTVDV